MASHQLAIAKASFSASLLRPDPISVSRDEIVVFHSLLNATIMQCSPFNVQKCKQWILKNIAQSAARFTALGKYLTTLMSSFAEPTKHSDSSSPKREPSIKRKHIHLLYIVNDILYHAKYHTSDASICGKVQPILVSLFSSAASFQGCSKHHRKIRDLLKIWEDKGYYSKDYIGKLREAVKNASELKLNVEEGIDPSSRAEQSLATKSMRTAPYVMPAMHGDAATPWFDLPAGNLMPHIVPNSTRPINPDLIKPLQFVAGPAEEGLVIAVKTLLNNVNQIYGLEKEQNDEISWDINELGQQIILDEITGDVIGGEGYYGWSRTFCVNMKRRRNGADLPDHEQDQGRRSQSRSSSQSSRPTRKRRHRQSDSESSLSGQDRNRRRRHSYNSSQSPSRSRSRSRSQTRSTQRVSHSYRRRSRPYSTDSRSPSISCETMGESMKNHPHTIPPTVYQQDSNAHFIPPPPPSSIPFVPTGPNGGLNAWPPPPPPLPPVHNMPFISSSPQFPWPPPPNWQQHPGGLPPLPPPRHGGWHPQMQPSEGRGDYNNNELNIESPSPQQHYQGRGSGQVGYRGNTGNSRGQGRS